MLKEFKELEEARKELKTRRNMQSRPLSFSLNMRKNDRLSVNPEKSAAYCEVKNRISKRYNGMFRKYAETCKEEVKRKEEILQELCKATKLSAKK